MLKFCKILFLASYLILACEARADIKFVQSKAGSIVEVPVEKVQSVCGKNFFFRETKKEEVPEYLFKEIVKAAFNGEILPSFELIISSLKSNSGKCAWVTPDELPKTK